MFPHVIPVHLLNLIVLVYGIEMNCLPHFEHLSEVATNGFKML